VVGLLSKTIIKQYSWFTIYKHYYAILMVYYI
jgi:hypothetical protein